MRHFFSRHVPEFERVLLVESGSRYLFDDLIPGLYALYKGKLHLDLLTCFAGHPEGFRPESGEIFRVPDYQSPKARRQLIRTLRGKRYGIVGIICAGEPIMTKWKWLVAAAVPAKVFVLNENGDYFWLDYAHWKVIRHFVLFRAGLAGAGAVRTLARLALFPATLAYLLIYAAAVHLRRKVHS